MCYVDGERATVWTLKYITPRKSRPCTLCCMTIQPGVNSVLIKSLFDGVWRRNHMHTACYDLTRHIQIAVCDQDLIFIEPGTLRGDVREHMGTSPEVLRMWRDILRARRAEGVWP